MEKLKNIIILTIEILAVVAIIIFIAIYIGASSTERTYQGALRLVEMKNYQGAEESLEQIPHYKDSSELYIYIYPSSLYYGDYKTTRERLEGYRNAINYIHLSKDKLKTKKYRKGFEELEKTIGFKIEEINSKAKNDAMISKLNDAVELIRKGDYVGAASKLDEITDLSFGPVRAELTSYIAFMNASNLGDEKGMRKSLEGLNPSYNGVLSGDISSGVLTFVDIMEWESLYNKNFKEGTVDTVNIRIGMKKEDVINVLGKPFKHDVISNEFGSFEKMTFVNNRIVYLENNVLVSFK